MKVSKQTESKKQERERRRAKKNEEQNIKEPAPIINVVIKEEIKEQDANEIG